jgi:hypothetical protein
MPKILKNKIQNCAFCPEINSSMTDSVGLALLRMATMALKKMR